MSTNELKVFLLWCVGIDYGLLLLWLGAFVYAHDWMYGIHTRWFKLAAETFDAIHYAGMAAFKIGIMLLGLVPLIALYLTS
jgi:hypothetical protein